MDHAASDRHPPPFEIVSPARQTVPVVFASPHSGTDYPPHFVAGSRLDFRTLRRSEDSFVDELFDTAPAHGAPLLRALFPRAFIDPNREPFELDPGMFDQPLPGFVNSASPRVAAGLGTIARIVANGEAIYDQKLPFAEAEHRVANFYRPYHEALAGLLAATRRQFGHAILIDCHSMPSIGGPRERDQGLHRVDFVLGDCHGNACDPRLTACAEKALKAMGYKVQRNMPYSGGFTTQHYGRPASGCHVLQIEINRSLYMDETAITRSRGFAPLKSRLARLIGAIVALDLSN